jgi:hypothetical protein
MPFLDVTEILTDPEFQDSLVCHRIVQTVGANGLATSVTTDTNFSGVVTSDRGDIMERIAGGERVSGSITIHTRFSLEDGAGSTRSADEVTWNGRLYIINNVNDYLRFGRGFIAATAELKPLAG